MKQDPHRVARYRCTHCQAPSSTLYRYLGKENEEEDDSSANNHKNKKSSIKLTLCSICGRTVDPYIERELLLVCIDCSLGRVEVFRHVLYNSDIFLVWSNSIVSEMFGRSLNPLILYSLAWVGLDLLVKMQSMEDQQNGEHVSVLLVSICSFAGLLLEWATLDLFSAPDQKRPLLFLALALPASFNIIILFVMIWENTQTIRILGSLLILYWQGIGLYVVVQKSKIVPAILTALTVRLLWRAILLNVSSLDIPCSGLDLEVIYPAMSLCLT